jgi:hypothetical protein
MMEDLDDVEPGVSSSSSTTSSKSIDFFSSMGINGCWDMSA